MQVDGEIRVLTSQQPKQKPLLNAVDTMLIHEKQLENGVKRLLEKETTSLQQ